MRETILGIRIIRFPDVGDMALDKVLWQFFFFLSNDVNHTLSVIKHDIARVYLPVLNLDFHVEPFSN